MGNDKIPTRTEHSYDRICEILNLFGYSIMTTRDDFNIIKISLAKRIKISYKDNDGYFYYTNVEHLQEGHMPSKFGNNNIFTIHNIRLWLIKNNRNFKLIDEVFISAINKLKFKCLVEGCGEIFETTWRDIKQGAGCPFCRGLKVSMSNCFATKSPRLLSEWNWEKNIDINPYNVPCGTNKNAWWTCGVCGHAWTASISNRVKGRGCPVCRKSKGEKRIREILIKNNVYFYEEYDKLEGLLSMLGNPLRFDFAIFDSIDMKNIICLIEYDGEFHYKKFYEEQQYETLKYHDMLKDLYCDKNIIKLIRIPYWDFNNIEDILINNNII